MIRGRAVRVQEARTQRQLANLKEHESHTARLNRELEEQIRKLEEESVRAEEKAEQKLTQMESCDPLSLVSTLTSEPQHK